MSTRRAFLWFFMLPSALAGVLAAVAQQSPWSPGLVVVPLAAWQFRRVRPSAIYGPLVLPALATIALGLVTVGGIAAILGYAAVLRIEGQAPLG